VDSVSAAFVRQICTIRVLHEYEDEDSTSTMTRRRADEYPSDPAQRGIQPARSFCGSFMGSMNMPGLSLTLLNVSTLAAACASNFLTVDRILGMIDAQHGCASWPAPAHVPSEEGRGAVVSRPPSPKTWWGTKRLFPTFGDFTMQGMYCMYRIRTEYCACTHRIHTCVTSHLSAYSVRGRGHVLTL
jgi:hypothetical protein